MNKRLIAKRGGSYYQYDRKGNSRYFTNFTPGPDGRKYMGYNKDPKVMREKVMMLHAIYGFSCGYPVCCVLDFLFRVGEIMHDGRRGWTTIGSIVRLPGFLPTTLQYFARCPKKTHENL